MFILTLTQRVFHGPLNEKWSAMPDLTLRERLAAAPALALMLVLGLCPQLLLGPLHGTVQAMVRYWSPG